MAKVEETRAIKFTIKEARALKILLGRLAEMGSIEKVVSYFLKKTPKGKNHGGLTRALEFAEGLKSADEKISSVLKKV